jgi:hypothetical protein
MLMLSCALAVRAFCQSPPDTGSDSQRARELKACGPEDKEYFYSQDTNRKVHPVGVPAPDKALVYVLKTGWVGSASLSELAVDGAWVGVNRSHGYFFFSMAPGQHFFCSEIVYYQRLRGVLVLNLEAGKTYYLDQVSHAGMTKASQDLTVMDEGKGQALLKKLNPSVWEKAGITSTGQVQ